MHIFKKLVAIEPVNLLPYAEKELGKYAEKVVLYPDIPDSDEEVSMRIGDADAVLLSYTSGISGDVIRKAANLKYIGMCCSLYSEKSANVDIAAARERNVIVKGIRDYGDNGVAEFVVSELVRLLHGFGDSMWEEYPRELTGMKVGIVGLVVTGTIVANALKYFGADLYYLSRTRKPAAEEGGIKYSELNDLLRECEAVCTCLNKNIVLLHEEQFRAFGNRKILVNTGGSPTFDMDPFRKFLDGDNFFICDMPGCLGDISLRSHKNVRCAGFASGMTKQAKIRLSSKVLDNLREALR